MISHLTKVKLSAYDRADICGLGVLVGFLLCVAALGLTAIFGNPVPMSLRTSLATPGVIMLAWGTLRLHEAATGKRPFKDDTRRSLLTDRHDGTDSP